MNRKRLNLIGIVGFCIATVSAGCAEKKAEAPPEPAKTEAQLQAEAAADLRQEQTAALGQRAKELQGAAAQLSDAFTAEHGVPNQLDSGLQTLRTKAGEVDSLVAELARASGEGWESVRTRLDAALAELEQARAATSQAVASWQQREAAALAARAEGGSPIDSASGLIEGLDGGEYEQYLASVVETAQERLRKLGLYAGPVDGMFDVPTMKALGTYQKDQGLQTSGVPSPMTRTRLFAKER